MPRPARRPSRHIDLPAPGAVAGPAGDGDGHELPLRTHRTGRGVLAFPGLWRGADDQWVSQLVSQLVSQMVSLRTAGEDTAGGEALAGEEREEG